MRSQATPNFTNAGSRSQPRWLGCWRLADGAQLLEFTLMLPLLVVLAVAVADFGAAFALRDKLMNAAREGARIGISQPTADLTLSNPGTVEALRDAVVNYLNNAGVPTSLTSTNPCATAAFSWTYCFTNGGQIQIDRQYVFLVNGTLALSTRVTLFSPYSWMLGRAVQLLVPSSSLANAFTISAQSVMQNL